MCMQPIDIFGDHAVCCTEAAISLFVTTVYATWLILLPPTGLLSPVMEKKGILGPTSGRRPGDVTIPIWVTGKGLAIDIAVTSSLNRSNIRITQH